MPCPNRLHRERAAKRSKQFKESRQHVHAHLQARRRGNLCQFDQLVQRRANCCSKLTRGCMEAMRIAVEQFTKGYIIYIKMKTIVSHIMPLSDTTLVLIIGPKQQQIPRPLYIPLTIHNALLHSRQYQVNLEQRVSVTFVCPLLLYCSYMGPKHAKCGIHVRQHTF
ncbi:hypothetical protein D1872_261440 [compost metagenome]